MLNNRLNTQKCIVLLIHCLTYQLHIERKQQRVKILNTMLAKEKLKLSCYYTF